MPAGHYTPAAAVEVAQDAAGPALRYVGASAAPALLQDHPPAASLSGPDGAGGGADGPDERSRDGAGDSVVPGGAGALYFGLDLSTPRDAEGNPTRVPVGTLLP
jgi:hypothetical protein